MALRTGLAVVAALATAGCASTSAGRPHTLPPPARESRAGAPAHRNAGPAPAPTLAKFERPERPEVARAVAAVTSLVGQRKIVVAGVDYGSGCAALARAAFAESGHPLPDEAHDAASLAALAERRGAYSASRRPVPGDLVFLADAPGGTPTHVGVVARSEPDGTAFVLHRVARGVLPVRINLSYPQRPTDPATGKHINDTLVVRSRPVPAGSLVVGVSDLLRRGATAAPAPRTAGTPAPPPPAG